MLHQLHKMSRAQHFVLACSSGSDSMAIANFYFQGGKDFSVAYFNHRTPQADLMEALVEEWAKNTGVPFKQGHIKNHRKPPECSPEEHWRNERYAWLHSFGLPVVTAHHLGDAAETYLFSAMNGQPKLISPANVGGGKWLYRPFLTNTKEELREWCIKHEVKWFEDESNNDVKCPRNRIRHSILPQILKINPGFLKVIKKKYLNPTTGLDCT